MIRTIEQLNKENFELREVFGHKVIATDLRISRDIIPNCLHVYEMQESDSAPFEIITMGKVIHINFESTILSAERIPLDKNGYRDVDEEKDIRYPTSKAIKLNEYLGLFEKTRKRERER